ncbi:MAG: hypothetical protein U9R75_01635, partial [Candidatus Thermoplasmatota archaeon]|nr:hypothetical protein [Candidatus Thermoplasmatota archaeon]
SGMYYRFIFEDANSNDLETVEKVIEIMDPIAPEIIIANYSKTMGTGEEMSISFSVLENVELEFSYAIVRINGEVVENITTSDGFVMDIPTDVIGELVFNIIACDTSMNTAEFTSEPVDIIDVIPPEIDVTYPDRGKVGEEIIISYEVFDNIGIASFECSEGIVKEERSEIILEPEIPGYLNISIIVEDSGGNRLVENITIFIEEVKVVDVDDGPGMGPVYIILVVAVMIAVISIILVVWKKRRSGDHSNEDSKEE